MNTGDTVRIVQDDITPDSPFVGLTGTLVKQTFTPGEWGVKIEPNDATMALFEEADAEAAADPSIVLTQIATTGAPHSPDTVFFYEHELEVVEPAVAA